MSLSQRVALKVRQQKASIGPLADNLRAILVGWAPGEKIPALRETWERVPVATLGEEDTYYPLQLFRNRLARGRVKSLMGAGDDELICTLARVQEFVELR